MATITAVKSGNWNDPTTWDLGRVPQSGDIVQCGDYVVNLNVAEIDLGNGEMVNDADYPSPSDVRQGVAYDYGDLVGTCAVPSPEFVARGVPVDDTEGQAVLLPSDIWNWPLGEASEGSIGKLLETKLGMITAGQITLSSPVTSAGNIVTVRGDDYHAEDGRALVWTVGTPADITGATIRLEIPGVVDLSFAGEVVDSETIRVELDAADTEMVPAGRNAYKLVAEQPDGDRITLAIGFWTSV